LFYSSSFNLNHTYFSPFLTYIKLRLTSFVNSIATTISKRNLYPFLPNLPTFSSFILSSLLNFLTNPTITFYLLLS
jgi:hypothetical protein